MSALNIFYCVIGALFVALGVTCVLEKYHTVRGAVLLPARILDCNKLGANIRSKGSGGYHYEVEFNTPDGARHTAKTNDSFLFSHSKQIGNVIDIWYNVNSPKIVERKSIEAELLSVLFVTLGIAVITLLGAH